MQNYVFHFLQKHNPFISEEKKSAEFMRISSELQDKFSWKKILLFFLNERDLSKSKTGQDMFASMKSG